MAPRMNALHNCKNKYQGSATRALVLCSAGLLRSPSVASYLDKELDYNCRAAGVHDYALIPVDEVLVTWADVVVCVSPEIADVFKYKYKHQAIIILDIPDIYPYKDPELMELIKKEVDNKL